MIGKDYKHTMEYDSNRPEYPASSPYENGRPTQNRSRDSFYHGDATGDYDGENRASQELSNLLAHAKTINLN